MKFRSLLGILAVVGVAVGAMSVMGTAHANTGIGPTIDISASIPANPGNVPLANTIIIGNGDVTVTEAATTVSTDTYSGYNASFVYDSSALSWVSTNDLSTPTAWGGTSLCLSAPPSDFLGALTLPQEGVVISCSASGGGPTSTYIGGLANAVFTPIAVGPTAVHMVEPIEAGPGAGTFGTYTIDAVSGDIQDDTYTCTASGVTVPATSAANPLCPIIAPSPFNSVAINVINPPPNVNLVKTSTTPSLVAGQAASYTITVTNPSATTDATNVVITDTLPAAMTGTVTFSGPGAADCGVAGLVVTCGPGQGDAGATAGTILASTAFTVNIDIDATDGTAGGTQPENCATVTLAESDPDMANNTGCVTISIIPPAVAWSKSPTSTNVWLADCDPNDAMGQCFGETVNAASFDEVMTNQGDLAGLGGFSFDLHYDPTQYIAPVIDLQPAIDLFAASGRSLDCSITNPQNGIIHVACASTGDYGVGPVFVGAQVMAHVTVTPQDFLVEAIRPNKENGDRSVVKDDQVTVTNTCGQPLNNGDQNTPDCQGTNLEGVGPGGVLTGNPNGGQSNQTIRRLEGDVNADCSVNVLDMQDEASRFGTSTGSLLYDLFHDVNSPLQHGDGEIDINDVQFVYGRFGSECSAPIPAQAP